MSLSSLQKKMTTTKSLLFVFLVGLLSLTFFVFVAKAAPVAPMGSTVTTTVLTAQTIQVGPLVSSTAGTGSMWSFATSSNNVTRNVVNVSTPTTTATYIFTGLSTNTLYYLAVAEGDGVSTSSYTTSSAVYTLAAAAGIPTVGSATASTVPLTINAASNPANTTYAVFNTTTANYLAADGSPNGATKVWQTKASWDVVGATGLSGNTSYRFDVIARNGDGVQAATSTASVTRITLPGVPSSVTVTAGGNDFTVTWTGDAGSEFYAEDLTGGTNSGWITGTTYSVSGINCGTTHTFRVHARNADLLETGNSSSVDGTTSACGTAIVVGGGSSASPAIPATPAVPGVTPAVPATPATPASVSLPSSASSVAVFVHTLRVGSRSNEVKLLQQKLRELGYFTYPTNTGYFGGATKAAVVAFQKAEGLKPFPGHVGPATRAALNNL